jgi:uncharacterized protein
MKALIVLLAVLAGVWLWRNGRQKALAERKRPDERSTPQPDRLQQMVCCPVCGVHLPRSDALVGRLGLYCSAAHRQQAES